jgi:hypothetical protein
MTRTWARELAERATVNAVNPGPVATDMYSGTTREFQEKMSHWTINTPLAAIRPGVDREEFVEKASFAGGRPVSADTSCSLRHFADGVLGLRIRYRWCDRNAVHTRWGLVYWVNDMCQWRLQIQYLVAMSGSWHAKK